ncbi:MAG: hypothetical protein V4654_05600, partial [Bdellovibrionota bacterium]
MRNLFFYLLVILISGCANKNISRENLNTNFRSLASTKNCGYNGYQRNPDGTYVVGGAYNGYQRNPDGTYVVGGAYNGYQRNPD